MPKIAVSNEIAAPVSQVFQLFTEVESAPERVAAVKQIEMLSTGSFGRGTRWLETRDVLGRLDDAEMEITSFEKDKHYTVTHHKGGVRLDTTFSFEPTEEGTRVTIAFETNSQGLPSGMLSPIEWAIGGKVREVLARDLGDLKRSVERVAMPDQA